MDLDGHSFGEAIVGNLGATNDFRDVAEVIFEGEFVDGELPGWGLSVLGGLEVDVVVDSDLLAAAAVAMIGILDVILAAVKTQEARYLRPFIMKYSMMGFGLRSQRTFTTGTWTAGE